MMMVSGLIVVYMAYVRCVGITDVLASLRLSGCVQHTPLVTTSDPDRYQLLQQQHHSLSLSLPPTFFIAVPHDYLIESLSQNVSLCTGQIMTAAVE